MYLCQSSWGGMLFETPIALRRMNSNSVQHRGLWSLRHYSEFRDRLDTTGVILQNEKEVELLGPPKRKEDGWGKGI